MYSSIGIMKWSPLTKLKPIYQAILFGEMMLFATLASILSCTYPLGIKRTANLVAGLLQICDLPAMAATTQRICFDSLSTFLREEVVEVNICSLTILNL